MDAADFLANFRNALKDEEIRSQLGGIMAEQLKNEIVLLRKEVKEKDKQIVNLNSRIDSLESENDALEQYTRRNSLRLFGLPEQQGEDSVEVALNLMNQTLKVEPPIVMEDLDRVHRVGKKKAPDASSPEQPDSPPKPRPIIVKFATYRARHRVITKKKALESTKMYINEDLTRARATMLYKARQLKRKELITAAWTHDGALVIKDKHDKIKSAHSLHQIDELLKSLDQPSS